MQLSWENRNQLGKRQSEKLKRDQQIRNSSNIPRKTTKRRQSLVQFMG
jgi:hypothetical protein